MHKRLLRSGLLLVSFLGLCLLGCEGKPSAPPPDPSHDMAQDALIPGSPGGPPAEGQ